MVRLTSKKWFSMLRWHSARNFVDSASAASNSGVMALVLFSSALSVFPCSSMRRHISMQRGW